MFRRFELLRPFKLESIELGKRPIVCAPLTNWNDDIKSKVLEYFKLRKVDLFEVRYDYFYVKGIDAKEALSFFEEKKIPFIFTFRRKEEGGKANLSDEKRLEIIRSLLDYEPYFVDLELSSIKDYTIFEKAIDEIKKYSGLIISYHNFKETPSLNELKNIARECYKMGADIVKIASLNRNFKDVLKLAQISLWIRKELRIPEIILGMGKLGETSRFVTTIFGSDVIYTSAFEKTAKGQPDLNLTQKFLDLLN